MFHRLQIIIIKKFKLAIDQLLNTFDQDLLAPGHAVLALSLNPIALCTPDHLSTLWLVLAHMGVNCCSAI